MNVSPSCPKCGGILPANAPSGVCPKCLMLAGLAGDDSDPASGGGSPYAATTPQPGRFIPPVPASLMALFPQLEILEVLGHGGMGAVYKARQSKLDRIVALKIIRPESADDPAFAERFNREARTLARLNHPQIVSVHDFGEVLLPDPQQGGQARPLYYFVMEYVDGANLRQLMESRTVGPDQALAIIRQICEALQFAHDEGIVHRDIKPENVLIDSKGRVKIADFGLAKLAARSAGDFTLTATHQVMGTPHYMAPEQMTGSHHVDHRADIYSLGVVFYELLTGEVPMGQFEPPSKRAAIDARLDSIVLRALAREPERRFQQASEMKSSVDVISSVSVVQPAGTRTPLPPRGASTIIEREIANAWHWVAGQPASSREAQPQFPTLLAIVLAIAGSLMCLLPWMEVTIPDLGAARTSGVAQADGADDSLVSRTRVVSHRGESSSDAAVYAAPLHRRATFVETATPLLAQITSPTQDAWPSDYARIFGLPGTIRIQPGETVTLHGRHVWPGFVASAFFACIAVMVWMLPSRLWSRWTWSLQIVLLAGSAMLCIMLFPMEVEAIIVSLPPPVDVAPVQAAVSTATGTSSVTGDEQFSLVQDVDAAEPAAGESAVGDQRLSAVSHLISYREGFYGSLGLAIALLLLGATGVRRSIAAGPQEPKAAPSGTRLRRSPEATRLAMLVLGITGALLTLASWFHVQITDPEIIAGLDGTQLYIVNGRTAHIVDFTGIDLVTGKLAAVLMTAAGLLQIFVPQKGRSSFITAILTALVALTAAAVIFGASVEIDETTVYLNMPGVVDYDGTDGAQIGTGWQWISHLQHEIEINYFYYACLGTSVLLLVLSAVGLRDALSGERDVSLSPAQAGAPVARVWFSVPAQSSLGAHVISHFESHGYRVQEQSADRWVLHRGSKMAGLYATDIRTYDTLLTVRTTPAQPGQLWMSCLWEIRTLGAIVVKKDITTLEAEGRELEMILRSNIPDGPATVLGGSIATRALSVGSGPVAPLSMPESAATLSSAAGATIDLEEVRSELDGPSLALIVVGSMIAIGHIGSMLVAMSNAHEERMAPLLLPGVISGLGMLIGGLNLRTLGSRGWAHLGIVSGFLPTGPGFVLAMPISIWSMIVFKKPRTAQAFVHQRRERIEQALRPGLPSVPRYSRKAIVGAVWAGLFLLIALPGLLMSFVAFPTTEPTSTGRSMAVILLPALPILLAPIGTTMLGCLAVGDIRHSRGRTYGLRLAVADALFFPLMLLNGAIFCGFMYFNGTLNMDFGLSLFTALSATVAIGTGISAAIIKSVWKNETRLRDEAQKA